MVSSVPRVDVPCLSSLSLGWELLGQAKVGSGSVAWLRIGPCAEGLDDALVGRGLRFDESGEVPSVVARNETDRGILLLAQSVLSGGLQTRALERSVILGPRATVHLPVHCIEQGRWEPRGGADDAQRFKVDSRTSVKTRFTTASIMIENLRARGAFRADQSAVWRHVEEELTRTQVVSTTRAYEAFLDNVVHAQAERARAANVEVPERANAAVVFLRTGSAWLEVFPTADWLAGQKDGLLAELFDDAASTSGPSVDESPDVKALLGDVFAHPLSSVAAVDGTEGSAFAFAGDRLRGSALLVGGRLAHAAIGRDLSVYAGPPSVGRFEEGAPPDSLAEERRRRLAEPEVLVGSRSGVLPRNEGNRSSAIMIRDAFARIEERGEPVPKVPEVVTGYRLVRATGDALAWIDVGADGPGFAILGAHDRCDLTLPGDATVWLRHLIAICVPTPAGPALRVIDLRTSSPFFLEDDEPRTSVLVTGTFGMRLGAHVICGFPVGRGEVAVGGGEVAPAPVVPSAHSIPSIERVRGANPYRIAPRAPTITPVPAPSEIQELLRTPRDAGPVVSIALEARGRGASIELPLTTFDSGVLIGRATNCYDAGFRQVLCDAVSRAHLLLLRVGERVVAFDVGSTNGTRSDGRRIRRIDLADAGTTLELAKKVMFRWRRVR